MSAGGFHDPGGLDRKAITPLRISRALQELQRRIDVGGVVSLSPTGGLIYLGSDPSLLAINLRDSPDPALETVASGLGVTVTGASPITLNPTGLDLAVANPIVVTANIVGLGLATDPGLEVVAGGLQIKLDPAGPMVISGAGLGTFIGDGIEFVGVGNAISVDLASPSGLEFIPSANGLAVRPKTGGGLAVDIGGVFINFAGLSAGANWEVNDEFLMRDDSASVLRRVTRPQMLFGLTDFDIDALTEVTVLADADFVAIYDDTASDERKISIANWWLQIIDIPALTNETTADDADSIMIFDSTAAAHREQTRADFLDLDGVTRIELVITSTQNFVSSATVWTDIAWDQENQDAINEVDLVASATDMVITEAGRYLVTAGIQWDNALTTAYRGVRIEVNGAAVTYTNRRRASAAGLDTDMFISGILELAASDVVTIAVYQNTGSDLVLNEATVSVQRMALELVAGAGGGGGGGSGAVTGNIIMHGANVAPTGFLICDGSVVNRVTFAALFAVIGVIYNIGGEAGTDFRLPNLQQRFPLGLASSGTGAAMGESGGAIDHVHTADPPDTVSTGPSATTQYGGAVCAGCLQTGPTQTHTHSTNIPSFNTGANNPPYLTLQFIIKT